MNPPSSNQSSADKQEKGARTPIHLPISPNTAAESRRARRLAPYHGLLQAPKLPAKSIELDHQVSTGMFIDATEEEEEWEDESEVEFILTRRESQIPAETTGMRLRGPPLMFAEDAEGIEQEDFSKMDIGSITPTSNTTVPDGDIAEAARILMEMANSTSVPEAHSQPTPVREPGRYYCDMCPESYTTNGNLTRHTSHKHQGHWCKYCGEYCQSSLALKHHKLNIHHDGPFACSFCILAFTCPENLRFHMSCSHLRSIIPR